MDPTPPTSKQRKPARPRRQFTDEFKAGAVRLVLVEGRGVGEVARDLDLTRSALDAWVRQAKVDAGRGPVGALSTADKEELARLRRENKVLRMERDILKKAAAFFAKENA
jgi:transposase